MKLSFCDFWDGFLPHENFFTDLFKDIFTNVEVVSPHEAEVLIFSCFGQLHTKIDSSKVRKIFFTGENKRPNFNECDLSFTFDLDEYNGRNIRIPLWLLQIDWFNKRDYGNPQFIISKDAILKNQFTEINKTKFCGAVFNVEKPERIEAVRLLRQYKPVDTYGKPFGSWFYGEYRKLQILSEYKFSICFENTIYPGYCTEKLIHARIAGNIPLYYGDKAVNSEFNSSSFINLLDYSTLEDFVEYVKYIDSNNTAYESYISAPFFVTQPEDVLTSIKTKILSVL